MTLSAVQYRSIWEQTAQWELDVYHVILRRWKFIINASPCPLGSRFISTWLCKSNLSVQNMASRSPSAPLLALSKYMLYEQHVGCDSVSLHRKSIQQNKSMRHDVSRTHHVHVLWCDLSKIGPRAAPGLGPFQGARLNLTVFQNLTTRKSSLANSYQKYS